MASAYYIHANDTLIGSVVLLHIPSWTFRPLWSILEHSGAFWSILEHPGASWSILEHPGASWSILEHPGASWSILGMDFGQPVFQASRDGIFFPGQRQTKNRHTDGNSRIIIMIRVSSNLYSSITIRHPAAAEWILILIVDWWVGIYN